MAVAVQVAVVAVAVAVVAVAMAVTSMGIRPACVYAMCTLGIACRKGASACATHGHAQHACMCIPS
jgi:hypothetical protein